MVAFIYSELKTPADEDAKRPVKMTMINIFKHPVMWVIFFLLGFIAGTYTHEHLGAPKHSQNVTIGKQKVKGEGNKGDFKTEPVQTYQEHNEKNKDKRREPFLRRIFGRRRRDENATDADL